MNQTVRNTLSLEVLMQTTLRDLVAVHPAVLQILGPLGMDLCCGGGHQLGEALAIHGIEAAPVVEQIQELMVLTPVQER
ncbi:MAG: DUF542 domain-containing protein [Thermomicrobiales bacterium]